MAIFNSFLYVYHVNHHFSQGNHNFDHQPTISLFTVGSFGGSDRGGFFVFHSFGGGTGSGLGTEVRRERGSPGAVHRRRAWRSIKPTMWLAPVG